MPKLKLTKNTIDALPTPAKDIVYWDAGCPGFGVKVTPRGRKVFIVLYRTAGAGSRLRKFTIGPYGRVTLHQARSTALKIFAARTEGRDPAAEKQQARQRLVADRVDDVVELYIADHVSKNRSSREISRLLRRELVSSWGSSSVNEVDRRLVTQLVTGVAARGTPAAAANKLLKVVKGFFSWCVGKPFWTHRLRRAWQHLRGREHGTGCLRMMSWPELSRLLAKLMVPTETSLSF